MSKFQNRPQGYVRYIPLASDQDISYMENYGNKVCPECQRGCLLTFDNRTDDWR